MSATFAAAQGSVLEQQVRSVLSQKGFVLVKYSDWKSKKTIGDELLLTNAPFTTIYQHPGHTEFLLVSKKYNLHVRIECKWQQSPGSVDEKLPYLYLNAIEQMPESEIIILIDGKGWKGGAITWLRNAVNEKKYATEASKNKHIDVFDLQEFIAWANTKFR
jgi:hypothetical protein